MRALSHCDFCGADAAGTFELLPPELEPTEDEQRRVVLCQACSAQLEELLEPLLARAGADRVDDAVGTESDAGTESPSPVEADDDPRSDDATDRETADGDEPDDADATGRPAVIDVSGAKTDADDDRDDTDPAGGSSTFASPDAAADSSSDADHDAAGESSEEADAVQGDDSPDAAGSSAESRSSPPRGYGKVIRLLRNRQFPMQRRDVETLATGAYDLEPDAVEEIIEYALEDGELEQEGDQLVRS